MDDIPVSSNTKTSFLAWKCQKMLLSKALSPGLANTIPLRICLSGPNNTHQSTNSVAKNVIATITQSRGRRFRLDRSTTFIPSASFVNPFVLTYAVIPDAAKKTPMNST